MIAFEEAQRRLVALGREISLGSERVAVDAVCGRVVADDVVSPFDIPAFDYSAMDGYAVALTSFEGSGPFTLPVLGESRPGEIPADLVPGCASRIFTGAAIPKGADAVVMQENVTRSGDRATFDVRPRAAHHIRRRGEDLSRGAVAIARGTRMRPAHAGLAAACDRAWIDVARRPIVTILTTGDELRAPGTAAVAGTIPESNGIALRAMAERAGAMARIAPIVRDDRLATEHAITSALDGCDVLVTVGGVSVGDHDWVRPGFEAASVTLDFWKVAMKPGKPIAVGRRGRTVALGLPGNPSSAMITFALLGVPLLRAMQGDSAPVALPRAARLGAAFSRVEAGRAEFLRATLGRSDDGSIVVTPVVNQASGAASSMAEAHALLCVATATTQLARGDLCDVLLIEELGA
jgi:molybdopterin molybdotransferase